MLRLIGFIMMLMVGSGGILVLDFNNSRKMMASAETGGLTFGDYLVALPERFGSIAASSATARLPSQLADMMPLAPDGWTMRDTTKADLEPFLPKKGVKVDKKVRDQVESVANARAARGADVVIRTYEKGDRRVVIQAIRHPDSVFTDLKAAEKRYDLRIQAAEIRGRPFMTVRGLGVTEEFLGDGIRARYFFAAVGAQIQIRVLSTKRMKDDELTPFFKTLHVQAMNASVVDRVGGLGEVPMILLGSAMTKAEREAYEADRSARSAEAITLAQALRQADEAAARGEAVTGGATQAEDLAAKPVAGFTADCAKGVGGIKRCSVGAGN